MKYRGRLVGACVAVAVALALVGPVRLERASSRSSAVDEAAARARLDEAARDAEARIEATTDEAVRRIEDAQRAVTGDGDTANSTTTSSTSTTVTVPSQAQTGGTGAPLVTTFAEDFEALPLGTDWADGSTHGAWTSVFNGFGANGVGTDGSHVLTLAPKASSDAAETHAGLVTTTASFGDGEVDVRMKTASQLRPGANAWEVAWLLWHYADNQHFYYLSLKPNGWELGKEDPAYPGSQRFLATGSTPTFPVGQWYDVRITQALGTTVVTVDGLPLTTFADTERPYTSGRVGLYTEDAVASFDDVKVTAK